MGQAKQRGTFQQRKLQSIQKSVDMSIKRTMLEATFQATLTPEQRLMRALRDKQAAQAMDTFRAGMAILQSQGIIPYYI